MAPDPETKQEAACCRKWPRRADGRAATWFGSGEKLPFGGKRVHLRAHARFVEQIVRTVRRRFSPRLGSVACLLAAGAVKVTNYLSRRQRFRTLP